MVSRTDAIRNSRKTGFDKHYFFRECMNAHKYKQSTYGRLRPCLDLAAAEWLSELLKGVRVGGRRITESAAREFSAFNGFES